MRRFGVAELGLYVLALTVPRWSVPAPAPRGGVERWVVKVAADPDSGPIDVANPIDPTLHQPVLITRPLLPPGNVETTRLSDERSVPIVDARLLKFKLESGRDGAASV